MLTFDIGSLADRHHRLHRATLCLISTAYGSWVPLSICWDGESIQFVTLMYWVYCTYALVGTAIGFLKISKRCSNSFTIVDSVWRTMMPSSSLNAVFRDAWPIGDLPIVDDLTSTPFDKSNLKSKLRWTKSKALGVGTWWCKMISIRQFSFWSVWKPAARFESILEFWFGISDFKRSLPVRFLKISWITISETVNPNDRLNFFFWASNFRLILNSAWLSLRWIKQFN